MSRYAVVDIGSNSLKLLVAERNPAGEFERVAEHVKITRLGEGAHAGRLREAAIRRTLDTITEFVEICKNAGVEQVAAVGTEALRNAVNGDEFVERAAGAGLHVSRISGTEEARLSYLAVRSDRQWRSFPLITVIDIGGGSTEVVRGGSEVAERRSMKLGAVGLTEAFLVSDPPTVHQIANASSAAGKILQDVIPHEGIGIAVGVGGTFTNLAAVKLGLTGRDPDQVHGTELSIEEVERMTERFAAMPTEERQRIAGIDPGRADIILAGSIILGQTLYRLGIGGCFVSSRGLRWGLLYDCFGRDNI